MRTGVASRFLISPMAAAVACLAAYGVAPIDAAARYLQDRSRTVWDGVYSADQAARGREAYDAACSSCHQPGLTGAGEAPALVGNPFMERWREDYLSSLLTRISALMPFDNPSTLTSGAYLDIVTYILQANDFPAGTDALEPDDLAAIRIVSKEGSGPVPNFALVQVIGCLAQGSNNTWVLTNGTVPVRTTSPKASNEAELKALEGGPLGTETYQLVSVYPSPEPHRGHRMEAKGFLVRTGKEARINVSSMQMVAPTCER